MDTPINTDPSTYGQTNAIVIDSDEEVLPEIDQSELAINDTTTIPQRHIQQQWQNAPSNPSFSFRRFVKSMRQSPETSQTHQQKHVISSPADYEVDSGSELFAYSDDESDLARPPIQPPNHTEKDKFMYPVFGIQKVLSSDNNLQVPSLKTKGTDERTEMSATGVIENHELSNANDVEGNALGLQETTTLPSKTADTGNASKGSNFSS